MAAKNKRRQNTNGVQQHPIEALASTTTAAAAATATAAPATANNPTTFESPLKLFGEAKDRINGLYLRLDRCVHKASNFYSDRQLEPEILDNVDSDRLCRLSKSIETIRSVLSRNQMKVAFFGRTSNGKSTVINAILHDKVLPDGYGHTTACFLQIQGNEQNDAFLEVQRGDGRSDTNNTRQPIESVKSIANALKADSLEPSTLVNIHWPISKCPLLKYDVVFVDSPGIDVEKNLDEWIDKHCHDADVFVLVANAEATITDTEKKFFHKVSEKLSKPNVFILNNRWDSIADDPESMSWVRGQHVKRAVEFLCDELKITTHEDAKSRTFFVSAKETLQARSAPANARDANSKREGYQERSDEFENFERRFEESLSKSAVKTKFKQHTDKGKETIDELTFVLKKTQSLVSQITTRKQQELQKNDERYRSIQRQFYDNEEGLLHELAAVKKRIQIVADSEVDGEIRRLSRIVDDFEEPFSPDHHKLFAYKEALYGHVEDYLGENLRSRITAVINKHVNPFNKVMCDIGELLSEDRQQKIKQIVGSTIYVQDDLFDLRIYRQFYTEFQEDLEFRFSLGLVSIIRKFQSKFSATTTTTDKSAAAQLDGSFDHKSLSPNTDFLSIMERFLMNPPQSQTTVGSLAVGGILVRTVGWKVIVVTTVVYGALYAYEYLTWTNSAKERTFKAQYVKYAKKGLQDCVPIISQHIANSVEQKMVHTFSEVKKEIDYRSKEVGERVGLLRKSLEKLQICDQFTRELLNENDVLMTELVAFASSFLSI